MNNGGGFERAITVASTLYVFLLPMALLLLTTGDWWLFAVNTGILVSLLLAGAILEGHEMRRGKASM